MIVANPYPYLPGYFVEIFSKNMDFYSIVRVLTRRSAADLASVALDSGYEVEIYKEDPVLFHTSVKAFSGKSIPQLYFAFSELESTLLPPTVRTLPVVTAHSFRDKRRYLYNIVCVMASRKNYLEETLRHLEGKLAKSREYLKKLREAQTERDIEAAFRSVLRAPDVCAADALFIPSDGFLENLSEAAERHGILSVSALLKVLKSYGVPVRPSGVRDLPDLCSRFAELIVKRGRMFLLGRRSWRLRWAPRNPLRGKNVSEKLWEALDSLPGKTSQEELVALVGKDEEVSVPALVGLIRLVSKERPKMRVFTKNLGNFLRAQELGGSVGALATFVALKVLVKSKTGAFREVFLRGVASPDPFVRQTAVTSVPIRETVAHLTVQDIASFGKGFSEARAIKLVVHACSRNTQEIQKFMFDPDPMIRAMAAAYLEDLTSGAWRRDRSIVKALLSGGGKEVESVFEMLEPSPQAGGFPPVRTVLRMIGA